MKERPILFSAPMVLAILEGRKTQTRRLYKNRKHPDFGCDMAASELVREPQHVIDRICPYGQPGDRLWVRETWAEVGTFDPGLMIYRADYPACVPRQYENVPPVSEIKWKPSIHMFRKNSRINLKITGVRVERLQDISEADAIPEGVESDHTEMGPLYWVPGLMQETVSEKSPVESYKKLWEGINGPVSWAANPWVWVIEFRRGA